ncbi:hypothetical protein [Mitsuokella multacida]
MTIKDELQLLLTGKLLSLEAYAILFELGAVIGATAAILLWR